MSEETVQRISNNIISASAEKAELEEYIKNQKAKLAELVEDGDTIIGDYKITKYLNRRFDDKLAKTVLTPAEYDKISEQKASSTLAGKFLSAELVDRCKKSFDSVIKVGLIEE